MAGDVSKQLTRNQAALKTGIFSRGILLTLNPKLALGMPPASNNKLYRLPLLEG